MLRKLLSSMLVGMVLTVTGCGLFNPIGPILQIGIAWIEGEAHKYYNTEHAVLVQATKDALKDLEFPIQEEKEDENIYHILAGDEGEDRFKIKITNVRHNVTKLSIRVNIMGDRPYAEMIYRHVEKQSGVKTFTSVAKLNEAVSGPSRRR